LQAYDQLARRFEWTDTATLDELVQLGSFAILVRLILQPAATLAQLERLPLANAIGWLHKPSLTQAMLQAPQVGAQTVVPATVWKALVSRDELIALGGLLPGIDRNTGPVKILSVMPQAALTSRERLESEVGCHLCLDDSAVAQTKEFEHIWRGFWYAANMLQLAPYFTITTASGVAIHAYESVLESWGAKATIDPEARPDAYSVDWTAVFQTSTIDRFSLERLATAGLLVPSVGLDLRHGIEVVGTAELAWEYAKIAVMFDGEQAALAASGWVFISTAEDNWITKVIERLSARASPDPVGETH
jgi:DEAD/DEAH box helicase domain-containing protein